MKQKYAARILAAFVFVGLCSFVSTVYSNLRNRAVGAEVQSLVANALPSIEVLTRVGDTAREIAVLAFKYPRLASEDRAHARRAIEEKQRTLDAELTQYLTLPDFGEERVEYEEHFMPAKLNFDATVARILEIEPNPGPPGEETIGLAMGELSGEIRKLMRINVEGAYASAMSIDKFRTNSSRVEIVSDTIAFAVAMALAIFVIQLFRRHEVLLKEHASLTEARATELQVFGERVAHDLLSPLSALVFCMNAFKKSAEDDPDLEQAMKRVRAHVTRAQGLVDGILEFACSGGKPELRAMADLGETIESIAGDIRSADERLRPDIKILPFTPCTIACNRGVLASVLGNLMRNAAKYMSDSAIKEMTVRVRTDSNGFVRVEVEDTGPGIPKGLESRIFEPYVRAEGVTQPGIGLGLATVKRLCLAYGGKVGVYAAPHGTGAIFWFTLPMAAPLSSGTMPIERADEPRHAVA